MLFTNLDCYFYLATRTQFKQEEFDYFGVVFRSHLKTIVNDKVFAQFFVIPTFCHADRPKATCIFYEALQTINKQFYSLWSYAIYPVHLPPLREDTHKKCVFLVVGPLRPPPLMAKLSMPLFFLFFF